MRSDIVKKGATRCAHRSLFHANGYGEEDLKKPLVGICNSFNEIIPGHIHLREIAEAPITPELVPGAAAGDSEDRLGPYELHDFFLYHFLANGASLAKLSHLAGIAFRGRYDEMTIGRTLAIFWRRFPAAQYKRNCVPDGPKITLSLSPRADWRMPSDSEFS